MTDIRREKYTIQEIRERVQEIEPTTMLLSSEYINNKQPLEFLCGCGEKFTKNWSTIQSLKTCKCRSCARKDGWKYNRRDREYEEQAYQDFIQLGFIPIEQIKSVRNKILCIDESGYKGYISLENARLGKHFSVFSLRFNKENLLFNLNNCLKIARVETKALSFEEKERTCDTTVYCQCECGEFFKTNIGLLTTQRKWRCSSCTSAKSTLEKATEEYLKELGIEYVPQKKFKGCINPKTNYSLKYDFYLPDYNMCIEVDGSQHDKVSYFGNMTKEQAEQSFKDTQERDIIKNNFCKDNNIQLLRIPYTAYFRGSTEYKNILNKTLLK